MLSTLDADAVDIESVRMQRRMKRLRQRSEIKNRQQQQIRQAKVFGIRLQMQRLQDTQQLVDPFPSTEFINPYDAIQGISEKCKK